MPKAGKYSGGIHAHTGTDRGCTSWSETLGPSYWQKASVAENARARHKITAYNHRQIPDGEANMNRLLTLKRDLCCYPDCPRKHIYWTPRGKFCGFHRDEALRAMAAAKRARYGA